MSNPSISEVESRIEELYSSNDSLVAVHIQGQLQTFQKQPYAWEIASQLLASQSTQCQFFGALTFQVKIACQWETLPEDRIEWLKNELLGWMVRLCGGPAFVTTKLCVALIAFAFHTEHNEWPHFMTSTMAALQSASHQHGVPVDMISSTILEFFTLVPEEVSNANLSGSRKVQLMQELKDNKPLVLFTVSSLLSNPTSTQLQLQSMKCLQSWIQYGLDLDDSYPVLQKVISLLDDADLFESAVDVLLESMQASIWTKYQRYRDGLLACFTSDAMKKKFESCITEEDEGTARLIAKLLTTFGETYTDYIANQLARPDVLWFMTMIIRLTGFEGFFPADQEVTEIPLNFWYNLQETLFDECILPVKQSATLDQDTDTLCKFNCGQAALGFYRELVKILTKNACYPDQSTWESWNKDIQDKFRIWRRDLGDTMINPFYVLREEMLAILLDHIVFIIDQWISLPNASPSLEAALFCLKSISEEISTDENLHIVRFFGPEVLGRLPIDCDNRLKNTVLALMGSLSEWLQEHPQYLMPVMNYIVPCLSDPQLALAAGTAFSDICDTCRKSLVDELDTVLGVYTGMASSNIRPSIMQKVVESVANVIQVLSPDKAMGPLMCLTGDILQGISKALANHEKYPQGSHDAALNQLQNLSACCRGIQSPTDDYQSLLMRKSAYDEFASGKLLAVYAHMDGFAQVTNAIRESSFQIAGVWGTDKGMVKALSTFLEQGMRSTSPLLSMNFLDLAALVESSYSTAPFSSWLDVASVMMTVYGGHEMNSERLRDLLGVLTTRTLGFINNIDAMEHYPDILDSYYGLLSRTITRCPLALYRLPPDMLHSVFLFVIEGMGLQENLALRAALNFMADFITQDVQKNPEIAEIVNSIVMNAGMQIMERLLLGIGGRVPRSFSEPLADVLYKMIGTYLQLSRQWLHALLSADGFPSALVNAKDKEAFLKIVGTRSVKRFKEITNAFSIKCRGLGNTSFGHV